MISVRDRAVHLLTGTAARFGLTSIGFCLILSGCSDLLPSGGYDKVTYRTRDAVPPPAAPAPPAFVAGLGSGGASALPQLAPGAPPGVTQEMVEQGAQQFGTLCAACHGPGGSGTAAAPALNDAEWLNVSGGFDEIVTVITTGVPTPLQFPAPMPPRGGGPFSDDQVRQLAAYVYALSHSAAP